MLFRREMKLLMRFQKTNSFFKKQFFILIEKKFWLLFRTTNVMKLFLSNIYFYFYLFSRFSTSSCLRRLFLFSLFSPSFQLPFVSIINRSCSLFLRVSNFPLFLSTVYFPFFSVLPTPRCFRQTSLLTSFFHRVFNFPLFPSNL